MSADSRGAGRTGDGVRRSELAEELYRRYGKGPEALRSLKGRTRVLRKRLAWWAVVGGAKAFKRAVDVAGSGAGLLALAPVFALVAGAIKAHDGGPVLFWQRRVGRHGREFDFPKFRSMVLDAERLKDTLLSQSDHAAGSVTFKMKHDPRITPVGRIIRKLSIDELPQLWCVLNGEMTLVGPRPPVPREVAQYTLADRRRLDVVPGLTCLWQVGGRGDIAFPEQVVMDVDYIESQSLLLDLQILARTVPAVLLGRGAY